MERTYEQLPSGFKISKTDSGKPQVSFISDINKEMAELTENFRFATIVNRPHSAYRQLAYALWEVHCSGDSSRIAAGGDRMRKYARVLREAGLEPVNFSSFACEIFIFATTRKDEQSGEIKFTGLKFYVENNDDGQKLLSILNNKPIRQQSSYEAKPSGEAAFVNTPTIVEKKSKKSS